jgi:hypothetical protein
MEVEVVIYQLQLTLSEQAAAASMAATVAILPGMRQIVGQVAEVVDLEGVMLLGRVQGLKLLGAVVVLEMVQTQLLLGLLLRLRLEGLV